MKRRRYKKSRPAPPLLPQQPSQDAEISDAETIDQARLSPEAIRNLFRTSADFKMDRFELGEPPNEQPVYLLFCEGMADKKIINLYLLPRLGDLLSMTNDGEELGKKLEVHRIEKPEDIVYRVFNGELVIYLEHIGAVYAIDTSNPPHRQPDDSNTEVSLKGPRDGFVEEVGTNVALVRKRLRSNSLCYEKFQIGKRSQTKVALLYIEDITQPELVNEVRNRLQKIDIDLLMSSAPLEELLSDQPNSIFPLIGYTTRPDFIADCLIRGRVAVIVDGSPHAAIAPVNLTFLLKSPEDSYLPYYIASFKLVFRFIGLWISLFFPALWAAFAAYNVEQIPFTFLATISQSRTGLPMPAPAEAVIMVAVFEIFREAGERLPKAVGQTVSVVGGLVVGEAAIRAGLASTTLVVVASITAVASYTLVNQSIIGTVSIIRLLNLAVASFLGIYGFILALIAVVLYMSRLESFGIPFLSPLSPIKVEDVIMAVMRKPWTLKNERPKILQTIDNTRQKNRGKKK